MDRLSNSKCDFCSKPDPKWTLPTRSFYVPVDISPVTKTIHAYMNEEWATCDECLAVLNSGNSRALAERVMQCAEVRKTMSAIFFKEDMITSVIQMQDAFRRNRLYGPPVMIT